MGLEALLKRQIAAQGPITVADFMALALGHPDHGYYQTRDPLGTDGDFTTAPEISQMFGEVIGLCLAQTWMDQGQPPATLVELGPGRGTLMADIKRATARVPGFANLQVHMVETSPTLRDLQSAAVPGVVHHDTVATLPEGPLLVVANEFFDALPIRQFVRAEVGWSERVIGVEGDALTFGLTPPAPMGLLDHRLSDTRPGDLVEICTSGQSIVTEVADKIARHGGAALIIDYGDWRSLGDTLQAVQNHVSVPPLAEPGQADLTAHVDFEALAQAAAPAQITRLTPQGVFLERLGITARAQTLAQGLQGAALETHIAAHRRLTHPDAMGSLFKVMGLVPAGTAPPPGLEI